MPQNLYSTFLEMNKIKHKCRARTPWRIKTNSYVADHQDPKRKINALKLPLHTDMKMDEGGIRTSFPNLFHLASLIYYIHRCLLQSPVKYTEKKFADGSSRGSKCPSYVVNAVLWCPSEFAKIAEYFFRRSSGSECNICFATKMSAVSQVI